jgi:hypothetical protein
MADAFVVGSVWIERTGFLTAISLHLNLPSSLEIANGDFGGVLGQVDQATGVFNVSNGRPGPGNGSTLRLLVRVRSRQTAVIARKTVNRRT